MAPATTHTDNKSSLASQLDLLLCTWFLKLETTVSFKYLYILLWENTIAVNVQL